MPECARSCGAFRMTAFRRVGHQRERDEAFKAWIQQQPEWACLIHGPGCGRPEPAHVRSRGAGGSDYWLLSLCFDVHRESHDRPYWWYANRVVVAEWCAFLPTLWARYWAAQAIEAQRIPPCPKCGGTDVVRVTQALTGNGVRAYHHCRGCAHEWPWELPDA